MLFQSGLALVQFFNHGSINGIFYWLGERNFTASTPGIANASINGSLILRPYGTLPHPNILAGYLLLGIIIVLSYWRRMKKNEFTNLRIFVLIISSVALVLTLSRVAILLWLIGLTQIMSRFSQIRNKIFIYLLIVVFFILILPRFSSLFTEDQESFVKRIDQTKIAFQMIKDHSMLGVGPNRYLVELPNYLKNAGYRDYQPVHNVFLLILAETGTLGFSLLCVLGFSQITSRFSQIRKNKFQISNFKIQNLKILN